MMRIRPGEPADLPVIAAIQSDCPEASAWPVDDYLGYTLLVADFDGRVAGFIVSRRVAPDETEILNLAVAGESRRKGVASALARTALVGGTGGVYLEVRQSNSAARIFYKAFGFQEVGERAEYYSHPTESAIVMKYQSC
jgi:[ribosomal protein S18]-alanine N-acetyltransferase